MSKFSTIEPEKRQLDELGFAVTPPSQEHDALLNLISKSKNIVIIFLFRRSNMPSRSSMSRKYSKKSKVKSKGKEKEHF